MGKTQWLRHAVARSSQSRSPCLRRTRCPTVREEQTLQCVRHCHEAAKATSVKLTREGWVETIDRMKAFGAAGRDDEFAAVLEYLADALQG